MRAALIHGIRDVRPGTLAKPEADENHLLLKVKSIGVCGSDLHYYIEGAIGSFEVTDPIVLGHEFAAEIDDDHAEAFGLEKGRLVAVDPADYCGHCEWCHAGYHNLCPNVKFTGAPPYVGAMSEYFTAAPHLLFPVPENFSADDAAMLEPLGVALHALDLARLRPLESVAILGAGPIGLLLLQVAQNSGAGDIFVIDPLAYRTKIAKDLGATEVANHHEAIAEFTKGRGVDVVLEATNSPVGPQHAAEAVRIGGRMVLVGIPEGDKFTMQASLVRRKGVSMKLSRRMGNVYPRCIKLRAEGRVHFEPIMSHRFSLEDTSKAFELQADYKDNVIKSMIHP